MAHYCNSLLGLRVVTVFFLILLVSDIRLFLRLFENILYAIHYGDYSDVIEVPSHSFSYWNNVDISSPPKLSSVVEESLRFLELVKVQRQCGEGLRRRNGTDFFVICETLNPDGSTKPMVETLVITGGSLHDRSFFNLFSSKRWTLYVPENFYDLDELGPVDVEINYLMRLRSFSDWTLKNIVESISNLNYDDAYIQLYSPYIKKVFGYNENQWIVAPKLLKSLLEKTRAQNLQIILEFGPKDTLHDVIYLWYEMIYRMFHKYGYSLLQYNSLGDCTLVLSMCRFYLSFSRLNMEIAEPVTFNFGSPLDEKGRLVKYITTQCAGQYCKEMLISQSDFPILCNDSLTFKNTCKIFYFRYRPMESIEPLRDLSKCQIHLFSPCSEKIRKSPSLHLSTYGISTEVNKSMLIPGYCNNENFNLYPITDLLNMNNIKSHDIDALLLDLDGAEWDILDALLESKNSLRLFDQISFRIRLWSGEENTNYRRFYSYFLRLERIGFGKFAHFILNDSTYSLAFFRNNSLI